jgi:hypothetical protein
MCAAVYRRRRSRTVCAAMNSDFVVFCFCKPEDEKAFAERFGGERLVTATLKTTRARCSGRTAGGGPTD